MSQIIPLPNEADLVSPTCCHPSVQAVVGDVGAAPLEPGGADGAPVEVKVELMVLLIPLGWVGVGDGERQETGAGQRGWRGVGKKGVNGSSKQG
jgi:hypothetical protein